VSAIRQLTYLQNRVEPDHRSVKRVARPRRGGKSFEAAQATRAGIELMPMLKNGQRVGETRPAGLTPAEPFYALVASPPPQQGSLEHPSKFATEPLNKGRRP
jgi:putative transposase